jgi:DNA polymerase V
MLRVKQPADPLGSRMRRQRASKVNPLTSFVNHSPETKITEFFAAEIKTRYRRPLYQQTVSAGFPSPAEDHVDGKLDLNQHFIRNPAATFFVTVSGDSMTGAGIHDGDMLIVDRSIEPLPGRVVIAVIDGEHTVKRLKREGDRLLLLAENADYPPLEVSEMTELHIWGVVTCVLHIP